MKEKIKEIRANLKLSQKAFAEKIGVSVASLKNYETGRSVPKDGVIQKICEIGGVSRDWFIGKAGDAAAAAVGIMEIAEDTVITTEIAAKEKTMDAGRKAGEAFKKAVSSDEAVAAEIEIKKKARSASRKTKQAIGKAVINLKDSVTHKTPSVYIQSQLGGIITPEEIINRIPSGCDAVYIKPEENKAYWVKGEENGAVDLW